MYIVRPRRQRTYYTPINNTKIANKLSNFILCNFHCSQYHLLGIYTYTTLGLVKSKDARYIATILCDRYFQMHSKCDHHHIRLNWS